MAFLEPLDFVVTVGQGHLGTISLSAPVLFDTIITIVSANPSVLTVDATVTILQGQSAGTFNANAVGLSGIPINIVFSLNGEQVDAAVTIDDPGVDSPPVIEHLDGSPVVTFSAAPVVIDPNVTVDDI